MISADERAALRATTADWYNDQVVIRRAATGSNFNATTLVSYPAEPTTIYDGPCLLTPITFRPEVTQFGEEQVTIKRHTLVIPGDSPADVVPGDLATITQCDADPTLVGRTLHILDVPRNSNMIDRALLCEDVE